MRPARRWVAVLAVAALAGCDVPTAPQEHSSKYWAFFTLVQVDGSSLPALAPTGARVVSRRIALHTDGTFVDRTRLVVSGPHGDREIEVDRRGGWLGARDVIRLVSDDDPNDVVEGWLDRDRMRIREEGHDWFFRWDPTLQRTGGQTSGHLIPE